MSSSSDSDSYNNIPERVSRLTPLDFKTSGGPLSNQDKGYISPFSNNLSTELKNDQKTFSYINNLRADLVSEDDSDPNDNSSDSDSNETCVNPTPGGNPRPLGLLKSATIYNENPSQIPYPIKFPANQPLIPPPIIKPFQPIQPTNIMSQTRLSSSMILPQNNLKFCYSCKSQEYKFELQCSHNICENCFKKIVGNATKKQFFHCSNSKVNNIVVNCPVCNAGIKEQKYCDTDWARSIKAAAIERYTKTIRGRKKCLNCSLEYTSDMFFEQDTCKHLCKGCLSTVLNLGESKCPYCKLNYTNIQEIKLQTDQCVGCKQYKKIVEDEIIYFCYNHANCYSCMIQTLKNQACTSCLKPLSTKDIQKVVKRVNSYKLHKENLQFL
jgi:hypothetical protein